MFPSNAFLIRAAAEQDDGTLRRLAALDSQAPLARPALIGAIGGVPAAAIGLGDGRVVADPFQATGHLRAHLRLRARSLRAAVEMPTVRERIRAAMGTS